MIVIGIVIAGYSLFGGLSSDSFSFGVGEDGATVEVEGLELMDAAEAEDAGGQVAPTIAVHVSGAVAAPGVYELEEGARVADAVELAGGFLEGAAENALNLARVLNDGEQVVVPTAEEHAAQQTAAEASGGAAGVGGKVNINTASAETARHAARRRGVYWRRRSSPIGRPTGPSPRRRISNACPGSEIKSTPSWPTSSPSGSRCASSTASSAISGDGVRMWALPPCVLRFRRY